MWGIWKIITMGLAFTNNAGDPLKCNFETWPTTVQPPQGKLSVDQVNKKLPNLSKLAIKKQKQLRLKLAPREFDDSSTCFHGDLMNCNRHKHLSFLNPQVLFLSKCLFTIYSVAWPINGRQGSLRFDPHRRKPCPWWHFITNSSFDDLKFIEKVNS